MSLLTFMEDPAIPEWYKRQKWNTAPQGAKNEYYYEKYFRNPVRTALPYALGPVGAMAGRTDIGKGLTRAVVPEDLEAALQLAGGVGAGMFTGGLGTFAGAEAGGTLGGMAMGRGKGEAAGRALPGALLYGVAPWGAKKMDWYERAVSSRATTKISDATLNLFKRLFADHPELELPRTPAEMVDFYGSGTVSPAIKTTGEDLGAFRKAIRTQPAFQFAKPINAPYKVIDPLTHTPRYGTIQMSLPDAIDYQQALYEKGYAIGGGPRGGIWAEPDRAIASEMRGKILDSMKSIPRSGPHLAQRYADLSRDYGVAQTVKDVFTKDIESPNQLLNHEKVYGNLADQKRLSHLNSLVGSDQTRKYLADVAPQRARIFTPEETSARAHMFPFSVHIGLPKAPVAPPEFVPPLSRAIGPVAGQSVTQFIERGNE